MQEKIVKAIGTNPQPDTYEWRAECPFCQVINVTFVSSPTLLRNGVVTSWGDTKPKCEHFDGFVNPSSDLSQILEFKFNG